MKISTPALATLVLLALGTACPSKPQGPAGDDHHAGAQAHGAAGHGAAGHGAHGHEGASVVETRWTAELELFVEFPALVVGRDVSFAAHLTDLKTFQAIKAGTVVATLKGAGGRVDSKPVPISRPGIFRPSLVPRHAGSASLTFTLHTTEGPTKRIAIARVPVFASQTEAQKAPTPPAPTDVISFLKEQQWVTPFATARVGRRKLRPSIVANGMIVPRAGGEARIAAPMQGRLVAPRKGFAQIGQHVAADQLLASMVPLLGASTDPSALHLDQTRARLALAQAQRTHQRLAALFAQGAVPRRRVLDAQTSVSQAQAQLRGARQRLGQLRGIQRGSRGGPMQLRSPIAGWVVGVHLAPGAFVTAGRELVHVIDLRRLWLKVQIPETYLAAAQRATGAIFEIPGFDKPFAATAESGARVIALGGVVDAKSRTVPLIIELKNPGQALRVGLYARVSVLTGQAREVLAIPRSALIDERGQDVVYVQLGGESFQRRAVQLGLRDGEYVEVRAGLAAGERVTVRGAYTVRLAASATAAPGHGHEH